MSQAKALFNELIKLVYFDEELRFINLDVLFEEVEEELIKYSERVVVIKNKPNYPYFLIDDEEGNKLVNEKGLDKRSKKRKEFFFK
jgi:hypothetical protein